MKRQKMSANAEINLTWVTAECIFRFGPSSNEINEVEIENSNELSQDGWPYRFYTFMIIGYG